MNSSKQIKWGALLSYISIAVNILSSLVYTPWMVASIGKSQYGLYTLTNSVITLFLVDFGLSSATSRYLAKYNAEGDREGAERFLGVVYKLYLLIDAAILCILFVVYLGIDRLFVNLTPVELSQFKVVYAISAIFSVVNFPFVTFNGILTAYEKFVPLKLADLLYRLGNVLFTVIALLLGYGLYALVSIHALVGLLVLLYKFTVIRKIVPLKVSFQKTGNGIYREIFGFSAWVTVSTLAARLVFNITPSVLGMVASSGAIAVFGIIATIEGYVYTITTAINGLFMTKISRIVVGKGEKENLSVLFTDVGKFQYILNGAIVAGFAVVGKEFICLWLDETYLAAYWGLLLVLVPGLFYNALEIANTAMVVTGKVKLTAIISLVTGVVNVCLSFPLTRSLGVLGACVSICVAYMVRAALCHFVYHRELELNVLRFARECYIRMSVPMVITVTLGSLINRVHTGGTWEIFLVKTVIIVCIYGLTTIFAALSKQDRQLLRNWLKK